MAIFRQKKSMKFIMLFLCLFFYKKLTLCDKRTIAYVAQTCNNCKADNHRNGRINKGFHHNKGENGSNAKNNVSQNLVHSLDVFLFIRKAQIKGCISPSSVVAEEAELTQTFLPILALAKLLTNLPCLVSKPLTRH